MPSRAEPLTAIDRHGDWAARLSPAAVRADLAQRASAVILVSGQSMWPLLGHRRLVKVRSLNPCEPRCGDMVVADVGSTLVIHRVIAVSNAAVTLQGDHGEVPDPEIPASTVLGIVTHIRLPLSVWLAAPHGIVWGASARRFNRGLRSCAGLYRALRRSLFG